MIRMLEIEHIKCFLFFGSAAIAQIGGQVASASMDDSIGKWIERGGTGLSIVLLLLGLRYMRGKLDARERRLDEMHDKAIEESKLRMEAEIVSAAARDKLASAVEKLSDIVAKK